MGLFDGIRDEINEMFSELSGYDLTETKYAKLKFAVLKDIDGYRVNSSNNWKCTDKLLMLVSGEFIPVRTKKRIGLFYKKAGRVIDAYSMLATGRYSGREVSKKCKVSWFQIRKILNSSPLLKCVCGTPLNIHRGCCKHRFKYSEARQHQIRVWRHRRKAEKKFENRFLKRDERRKAMREMRRPKAAKFIPSAQSQAIQ